MPSLRRQFIFHLGLRLGLVSVPLIGCKELYVPLLVRGWKESYLLWYQIVAARCVCDVENTVEVLGSPRELHKSVVFVEIVLRSMKPSLKPAPKS